MKVNLIWGKQNEKKELGEMPIIVCTVIGFAQKRVLDDDVDEK